MRDILHITDEGVTLSREGQVLCALDSSFEESRPLLESYLKGGQKIGLVVDQDFQTPFDEKVPSLWPWDKARLLFHKKASLSLRGGYGRCTFIQEKRETCLRSVYIPLHSPLLAWIEWAKLYQGRVCIGALEVPGFLKYHTRSSKTYQMLVYPLPSGKKRHLIFKGKHLLLSRLVPHEEDEQTSLHFLSRTYSDLRDGLEITQLTDPLIFMKFVGRQRRSTFALHPLKPRNNQRPLMAGALMVSLVWSGLLIFQGIGFRTKTEALFSVIVALQHAERTLSPIDEGSPSRKAIEAYGQLVVGYKDPLEDIETLSHLLEQQDLYLEKLAVRYGQGREIMLEFLMRESTKSALATRFEKFLEACHGYFPTARLEVMSAPLHSSPHETFKMSVADDLILTSLKITMP